MPLSTTALIAITSRRSRSTGSCSTWSVPDVRPDVSEQLDGIRRILEQVIAPHVADPYAASILRGLLDALGGLATGWSQVPLFLRWDTDGTAAVLNVARPYLDEGMIGELNDVLDHAPDDDTDVLGLETHHRSLRGLLERAVPAMVEQPDIRSVLIDHFRARIARFPLSMAPPTRSPQTGGISADAAR